MKVLIADKFPAGHLCRLEEGGHESTYRPDLAVDELAHAIGVNEALVVRSTRVSEPTLCAGSRLELVIRAGAGTNTIDTEAASALGVSVCNVPGRNAVAVAELTLGLMIALDRRIADNVADLRAGRWDKKRYAEARGLMGASMGIVGLGAIGMAVAERAHAFGLRDRSARQASRSGDRSPFGGAGRHLRAERRSARGIIGHPEFPPSCDA